MNIEKPDKTFVTNEHEQGESHPTFGVRVENIEGGGTVREYTFPNVVFLVSNIEADGEQVPIMQFRTYDTDPSEASLDQPENPREGVTMEYVLDCLKAIAMAEQTDTFQVSFHYEDGTQEEIESRKRAEIRRRLFQRYVDLEEVPEKDGRYIVTVR